MKWVVIDPDFYALKKNAPKNKRLCFGTCFVLFWVLALGATNKSVVMLNNCSDETEVIRVASEIKRYLGNHPKGKDTIDGITQWWLPRQRIEESALLVKQALDYLVAESLVERKASLDGHYLYFRAKQSRDEK